MNEESLCWNKRGQKIDHLTSFFKMKKIQCPICLRHKSNMNTVIPCMHLICYDCLSVWVADHGQKCPYCRSQFERSCSCDENGNIKTEIANKTFKYDVSTFLPPTGSKSWQKELQQKWPQILEKTCNILYEINIYDNTILAFIIKTIHDNPQVEANTKVNSVIGQLYPDMVNHILEIYNRPNHFQKQNTFNYEYEFH